ncbi:MAG: hypothetical protein F6K16_30640 [Symploca sp. SIO2B6]|nr:hypothetical protein [Symploca sp. SIO2B6]
MKKQYSLGVISQSRAVSEMRSPIWHRHLPVHTPNNPLIKEYIFEKNFGSHTFQESADDYLVSLGYKTAHRSELLASSDIVISLKPIDEWEYMRPQSILIGWFNHLKSPPQPSRYIHFIDLEDIKIFADGREQKLLYKNAYVAGECGVAQTIQHLRGIDSSSPAVTEGKLAVVIGYGNLGRGATRELINQGIEKIVVFTQRQSTALKGKLAGVEYRQMEYADGNTYEVNSDGSKEPLVSSILAQADIVVNAKIPSKTHPKWTFIPDNEFHKLKLNMVFIDPVHRNGHGADFVQVTSLEQPLKKICRSGHSIWFNGCNAMPSYNADYASSVISEALLSNLDTLIDVIKDRVAF